MKVETAVGELAEEYGDRVDFVVVPAEETAQRADEIERFGFTHLRHGLVAFGPDGEVVAKIPGHDYGADEIRAATEAALAR